jgi:hypothetical protein
MSGNAAAVLTRPAFRKIEWLARDIAVERRLRIGRAMLMTAPASIDGNELPTRATSISAPGSSAVPRRCNGSMPSIRKRM